MQKKVVALSLALPLGVAVLAQTYRAATTSGSRTSLVPAPIGSGDGTVDKNPKPREVYEQLDAAFVPVTKAAKHARQLLSEGKLTQAEVECRRAIALAPKLNGQPWANDEVQLLGDILLAQGKNHDALECYLGIKTSSKPDDPENPRPNLKAALAYCRLGNFKMAKKYCPDEVITKMASPGAWPNWPGAGDIRALEASLLFARACDEGSMSNYRGALSYLEQAEKLAPKNWLIAYVTGRTLLDLERRDEMVSYYKRVTRLGGKLSYEDRMRVEMHDLRAKQDSPNAPGAPE